MLQGPRVNSLLEVFERIASGRSQVPRQCAEAAPDFLRGSAEYRRHDRIFRACLATFYRHGCASIPYEIEELARVDAALLRLAVRRGASEDAPLTYWETSSADGTRGRTLAEYAGGRILTLTDSPSQANRREFERSAPHPRAYFHHGPWVDLTPEFLDHQSMHPAFRAGFDVIWENTTFQMYGNKRVDQIAYIKRVLKPDGLVLFFEKMNHPDRVRYERAEHVKDAVFKARYFEPRDVLSKRREILAVMEAGQVTLDELAAAARVHFLCGALIWNSTNFYEVVATDSRGALDAFLSELPDAYVPDEFAFEHPMVRRLW
jgi:SAM-dependent methyltransferase